MRPEKNSLVIPAGVYPVYCGAGMTQKKSFSQVSK